ncbi:MAG: S1C family serine protease [Eubacteriales bacterium]|nr:S1C family serine protease [Eubacteriales bacterium]
MDEKQEKNKKKFISEKIVGRELTLRHATKYIILAVACGILFGITAAVVFSCARGTSALRAAETGNRTENTVTETDHPGKEDGEAGDANAAAGTGTETGTKTGDNNNTGNGAPETDAGNAGGDTSQDAAQGQASHPAEDGAVSGQSAQERGTETDEPSEHVQNGGTADQENKDGIEGVIRDEMERYSFSGKDLKNFFARVKEEAKEADRHIVSVQAVKRDTGWFNDPIETAQLASGIITAITSDEIQILTTEDAVQSADSLTVTFRDGTVEDAMLRKTSHLDGMALLAVSKERLGSEFLSSISAVPLGGFGTDQIGEPVLALGSPLGVTHSMDVGFIGYVMQDEQTADGSMEVIYTDIASNEEKGTFLLSLDGTLLGMARPEGVDTAVSGQTSMMNAAHIRSVLSYLSEGRAVPYIGILGRTVSSEMIREGLPAGAYVNGVRQDSPAYVSGIKNGDIVIAVGDTETGSMEAYRSAVHALSAGETVELRVMRGSGNNEYRELSFSLTVGER